MASVPPLRFFIDQCVPDSVGRTLKAAGYEVALLREKLAVAVGNNQRIGHRTLAEFQRWAIRVSKVGVPFEAYEVGAKGWGYAEARQGGLF